MVSLFSRTQIRRLDNARSLTWPPPIQDTVMVVSVSFKSSEFADREDEESASRVNSLAPLVDRKPFLMLTC
jgi:hypothetical protein